MEVRRRRAGGASWSSASDRDTTEVVRLRPGDERSQWTVTDQRSSSQSSLSLTTLSTALSSLGESPLVTFIIDLVKQAMNMLWAAPGSAPAPLDPRFNELLAEFRDHTTVRYDPSNPEHEEQLLFLWAASFPQESLDDRVSDQWKRLGFQGRDPATDFRGCGVFGLQQLVTYARKYPSSFQFHLKGRHHDEAYPFAITAINLVNLIFQLLGWGMRPSTSPAKAILIRLLFADNADGERRFREETQSLRSAAGQEGEDEAQEEPEQQAKKRTLDAFSEVFVATFHLFDKEWKSANAHYMDFPKVIASTQTKLEAFLGRNRSVDDIVHFNYTNNMAISEH